MAAKQEELRKIISGLVAGLGYECVGTVCDGGRGSSALRVFIDSPNGISHDDCARVSRAVSEYIDRAESGGEKFFSGKYFIEVSSPGIERPLYTEEHYARFAGSRASLRVRGRGKIQGTILSCEGGAVTFRTAEGEEISLPFADIVRGNIAL
jgi:ribosome maturation factor RimP